MKNPIFGSKPQSIDVPFGALAVTRQRIVELQDERNAVEQQLHGRAAMMSRVYEVVDALAEQGARQITESLCEMSSLRGAPKEPKRPDTPKNANFTFRLVEELLQPYERTAVKMRAAANLVVLIGPEVLKSRLQQIADGVPVGLDAKAREQKLAQLDRDLLEAEIAEELALRAIENASGEYQHRRPDANPAVVLAPEV